MGRRRTPPQQRKPTPSAESRLNHHLSSLPPTNFSIHPRDLHMKYYLRPKIHVGCSAPTTKSWLPSPPRCGAPPRLPQLRLITADPPESPRPDHFLADPGSILEPALERGDFSYWSLLEYTDAKTVAAPSDGPRRKLRPNSVRLVGPDAPCPGIIISHSVVTDPEASRGWPRPPTYNEKVDVRYVCAVADPFDARRKPMEFAAVIRFGGKKLYGMSLQGAVASMDVIGARLRVTGVGPTRGVPSSRTSRLFKEYLVKMEWEILLVFMIHTESDQVVDGVEVYRLDLEKLDWVKVERLQGKTMFLKESLCEFVESAEFGCRDNCVFFTEGNQNNWRVYDFKTCCVSSV